MTTINPATIAPLLVTLLDGAVIECTTRLPHALGDGQAAGFGSDYGLGGIIAG